MKISLSGKDAIKSDFGAQEGFWEIASARSVVYQFPPNKETGQQGPPSTMIQFEMYKLDPHTLERVDEEPVHERWGFGAKNTTEILRPGKASAPGQEPEDLGSQLGTEGNTIFADPNFAPIKIYQSCAWSRMSLNLIEKGFKEEYLQSGWLPYIDGTKVEVAREKSSFKSADAKEGDRDRTNLVIKQIKVYGYEKKGGKPAPKAAPKPKAAATVAAAPGPVPASPQPAPPVPAPAPTNGQETAGNGLDYNAIAVEGLNELAKANKGREVKKSLIQAGFMTYLMRRHQAMDNAAKTDLVNHTIKDDDWLAVTTAGLGIGYDVAGQVLVFPA